MVGVAFINISSTVLSFAGKYLLSNNQVLVSATVEAVFLYV